MLYRVQTTQEVLTLPEHLPTLVIAEAKRVTDILDKHYNSQGIDGGYVSIAETKADIDALKKKYFNYPDEKYEFIDNIGDDWISALYIDGTEYHQTLILPRSICGIN